MRTGWVAVDSAREARERDAKAIASGVSSQALMRNAGHAAALVIMKMFHDLAAAGVEIHTGPGNNGGDGWLIAAELASQGIPVRVIEAESSRSKDAIAAREIAVQQGLHHFEGTPGIVVDALLGTGSTGAPRGDVAEAIRTINRARESGAKVVAVDVPSGLDATTGALSSPVIADVTLALGSLKRGHLVERGICGKIEVLDIGLGSITSRDDLIFADPEWVYARIPALSPNAHKGTRKRLTVIAGDVGMAGAAILAGKGALRAGIGLLHLIVAEENRDAVHCAIPSALVSTHRELALDPSAQLSKADAIVIGPGLTPRAADKLLNDLAEFRVPLLLDAGGISIFDGDTRRLLEFCRDRTVVMTPHPAEMGRLLGKATSDVLAKRFEIGAELASDIGATVLLKGTPTVISDPARRMVTATGTPALATGGSGDVLCGIVGTLLAQTQKAFESAVCGAWTHGRAAEICGASRGVTLEDILFAMPAAWKMNSPLCSPPVTASLPAIQ